MKLTRVASITAVLLEEGLGFLTQGDATAADGVEVPDGDTPLPLSESEAAVRLRRTLERLGPTFVKFGQMLATRVDLFGEAFIEELAKLHSDVKPFATAEAHRILAEDLGPLDEVFAEIGDAPVAAASIAQVYKARLADDDGSVVAVKVQRPGLEESLISDLDTLLVLSGFIDRLVPRTGAAWCTGWRRSTRLERGQRPTSSPRPAPSNSSPTSSPPCRSSGSPASTTSSPPRRCW